VALAAVLLILFLAQFLARGNRDRVRLVAPAAERAQPILSALARYQQDKGKYPEALNELVPDYLEAIPATGVDKYPRFYYFKAPRHELSGGSYELGVPCTSFHGFDRFFYWPTEVYPDHLNGNGIERVGKWARNPCP